MSHRYPIAMASALALFLIGTLSAPAWAQTGQNILMIIADDIGVDMIGAYEGYEYPPPLGTHDVPPTPTIDQLATQGIQFLNTWSNPLCATTRATIQTGRYGYRTGVLGPIQILPDEEFSIAEILSQFAALEYTTATIGKWGLHDGDDGTHPVCTGYDFFAGDPDHRIDDYSNWEKHTAYFTGASGCDRSIPEWHNNPDCIAYSIDSISDYATKENVDDTIDWIGGLPPDQPWFAILSFNAAHAPFHAPPTDDPDCPGPGNLDCTDDKQSCYRAMIEVMDCHIGRLFTTLWPSPPGGEQGEGEPAWLLPSDTTIIFVGDNGSPPGMARAPFDSDRAKGNLYEGGINIPLIIAGAGVSGTERVSQALVNTSDLFMTVLELAGMDPSDPSALPTNLPDTGGRYEGQAWEHDSFSLVPILSENVESAKSIREYAYAEVRSFNRAIRNRAGYKLLRLGFNGWEFYDLNTDRWEDTNLVDGLIDPETGELLEGGLGDAEAEAAYFDLFQKLESVQGPKLPAANLDSDADAIANDEDNCVAFANPDQLDTNEDGYGNACDADYDNDGDVDDADFDAFKAAYGRRGDYDPDIDCEGDGRINASDFVCFKRLEGLPPGPSGLACAGTVPCVASE